MRIRLHSELDPDELAAADLVDAEVWPEYNRHGTVLNRYWRSMLEQIAEFQFVVEADEGFIAEAHSIPVYWDGTFDGSLAGIDAAMEQSFAIKEAGGTYNAVCAMAAEVPPGTQGKGLSTKILEAMKDIARTHGYQYLVAPVRPNLKERYPLTPIERYVRWTRPDGSPFDPWIRVHVRMGAEIQAPLPRSMLIGAPVGDWESWTGMRFPETGTYVFPGGLAPLEVNVEADNCVYWEPNVWIVHRV